MLRVQDLLSNRLFMGALIFFILMVVGGTLYLKHVERQMQIELERTEEIVKRLNESNTTSAEMSQVPEIKKTPLTAIGDTAQGGHWHGDEWHTSEHSIQETPLSTTHKETPEQDIFSGESHPDDSSMTQMKALQEKINGINTRIQAKYPEFAELTSLTPEEIAARYPTESDRILLAQRANDFLAAFLQEIKEVFADTPIEIRTHVFNQVRNQLTQSWGDEASNATTEILQGLLE